MSVTSKSSILVLGTIDPAIFVQLVVLAIQHGITVITELPSQPVDPIATVIEKLRIEPCMARPEPKDSTPYYRRFERRRHCR
jgi:hypothetical protein